MSKICSDILVYLDGSEGSLSSAMYAIMLAKANHATLHALYVVNTKALSELLKAHIFINMEKDEYLKELEEDSKRHIRHMHKLALSKGVEVITETVEGAPHVEVMRYIKENEINLLVLGSINAINSRREELLSETDRMLRTSPCPVLVVKDDEEIWNQFEELS